MNASCGAWGRIRGVQGHTNQQQRGEHDFGSKKIFGKSQKSITRLDGAARTALNLTILLAKALRRAVLIRMQL